jgi:drug/metabolite transporter (DMT)-like permease
LKLSLNPHYKAVLQALFVTFLWSTSWVFIKIGLEEIPALTFAGLRYFLAFLMLLPLVLRRGELKAISSLSRSDWGWLALLGLLLYTITQGTQFLALNLLPAVTISLLLNFTSVIVAVMGIFMLAEWPTRRQWLGTAIFIAGVLIYFYQDLTGGTGGYDTAQILGLVIAVTCVVANAASSTLGRFVNRSHHLSPLLVTVISMGIGAALLLVVGLATQGLPSLSWQSWLIILWLATANTAFAFTLWNQTLRTLSAMESSIINNTMLIQIAILAWVFLGESLLALEMVGLLLAAGGILLVQLRTRGKRGDVAAIPPDETTATVTQTQSETA